MVTNFCHALFLTYVSIPARIQPELLDLYNKIFTPLKVEKKTFKELVSSADILSLKSGECYAVEGVTIAGEQLSILLSGKMEATCKDILLHYLHPNEFIDSPEWEGHSLDSDKVYQVTLTAVEPCRYICWPRRDLQLFLNIDPFMSVIIHNLIGKDITNKLYSLNEFHQPSEKQATSFSASDWWRYQIPRSLSVDAVHTGTKGHVRSVSWKTRDHREHTAPSHKKGSSPPNIPCHFAHCSDPGQFHSLSRLSSSKTVARASAAWHFPSDESSSSSASSSSFRTTSRHVPGHVSFETSV
ncbi:popeye domain-containing protein 1-like [Tachypleus tridentatus]|uniref:popeye domain-containing protein 1-like n=1 Tax=Tachypleus tridentatus TaxID=6853 RepID=UPI003FD4F569